MVSESLARLSNNLVYSAMAVYALAMISYAAELAFGARSLVVRTDREAELAPARQLATVGGPSAARPVVDPPAAGPVELDSRVDRWGRIGVSLTVLAALLHLGAVVARGAAVGRPPWGNMCEFAITGSLLATLTYLVVLRRWNLRHLGLVVVAPVLLLLGLAMTVLYVDAAALVPALHSYWLVIHVTAAMIGFSIFAVGAATTVLYLAKDAAERSGSARPFVARLPAAASLDRVAYRLHAFAFPIYTFAVVAGAIWAEYAWGRYWGWDPKETWAFITWVCYAGYLHARATAGWKGRAAALVALLGFSCFLFNFFGVNFLLPGLHSYAK